MILSAMSFIVPLCAVTTRESTLRMAHSSLSGTVRLMTWNTAANYSANALSHLLGQPDALVVCGSGVKELPGLLGEVVAQTEMRDVPAWPVPVAQGHGSSVQAVLVDGLLVWVATGRVHLYDGLGVDACAHAVRAAHLAGAGKVVLTNAAGSLNHAWQPGSVVAVEDHVNLLGENPLCGEQPDGYLRFVPLSDAYDEAMLDAMTPLCSGRGVYAAMRGPSYETSAEIRMLASFGASLVGMSSIPEALAARQANMRVATISVVSNMATGMATEAGSHDEVLEMVKSATPQLAEVVRRALLA